LSYNFDSASSIFSSTSSDCNSSAVSGQSSSGESYSDFSYFSVSSDVSSDVSSVVSSVVSSSSSYSNNCNVNSNVSSGSYSDTSSLCRAFTSYTNSDCSSEASFCTSVVSSCTSSSMNVSSASFRKLVSARARFQSNFSPVSFSSSDFLCYFDSAFSVLSTSSSCNSFAVRSQSSFEVDFSDNNNVDIIRNNFMDSNFFDLVDFSAVASYRCSAFGFADVIDAFKTSTDFASSSQASCSTSVISSDAFFRRIKS